MENIEENEIQEPLEEDLEYFDLLNALVQLEDAKQSSTPDLRKIHDLHQKSMAKRAKLKSMALEFQLMTREESERFLAENDKKMLEVYYSAGDILSEAVLKSSCENEQSHVKIRARNQRHALKAACRKLGDELMRTVEEHSSELNKRIARARKIEWMLLDETVEHQKAELRKILSADS